MPSNFVQNQQGPLALRLLLLLEWLCIQQMLQHQWLKS
jgi:hypothetical protein